MKYFAKYRQIPLTNDKHIQNESNVNRLRSLSQKCLLAAAHPQRFKPHLFPKSSLNLCDLQQMRLMKHLDSSCVLSIFKQDKEHLLPIHYNGISTGKIKMSFSPRHLWQSASA